MNQFLIVLSMLYLLALGVFTVWAAIAPVRPDKPAGDPR